MGSKLGVLAAAALFAAAPASAASGAYTITELKPLHGTLSYTLDVNIAGQATGVMTDESATGLAYRGFFYDPGGGVVDIGGLGGRNTFAVALNDAGLVTGWSQTASGVAHAFVFTPGVGMRDIGGGALSFANDIGASGSVIGGLPGEHAFVWTPAGGAKDVGPGAMLALNFQGDAFGSRSVTPGVWSPPYAAFVSFPAIAGGAQANGGNIFGHSAGTVFGVRERAFFWDGRAYADLTPAGMRAASSPSINDADSVVVHATDAKGVDVPFLFPTPSTAPVRVGTLNPAGSPFSALLDVSSIDDLGHIGGSGRVGSDIHGFVLTPPFETEVESLGRILRAGLPTTSPFASFLDRTLDPVTEVDATSCFELRELRRALGVSAIPFTVPQRQVAGNAIEAIVNGNGCMHATPAVPVTVPHVFVRKGERAGVVTRVPGPVTVRVEFPSGSRFDVVNVRETGAKPKVIRRRGASFLQVRILRLRAGTLGFTVVARKLLGNKATPVTVKVF